MFLEPKYDGTNILFCKTGIFKHNGDPVTKDQLAGLLHIAYIEPDSIKPILSNASNYTFAAEMFGSAYTPMGVHKSYTKPYTISVFEVGEKDTWIPPPEKYEVLSTLRVNYVEAESQISTVSYQKLLEHLESEVSKFTGEGLVVKANAEGYLPQSKYELQYIKPGGLFIFKYKKLEFKGVRVKVEVEKREAPEKRLYEVPSEAKDEILNELHKLAAEMGKEYLNTARNTPLILDRVMSHIMNDHPVIWEMCKGISERDLKKSIVVLLREVQKEL